MSPRLSGTTERLVAALGRALAEVPPGRERDELRLALVAWHRSHPRPRSAVLDALLGALEAGSRPYALS